MPRNPNGAGTVYREAGRAWCSEAHVDLPDGRRVRVRGRGDTPEMAVRARIAREQHLLEDHPAPDRVTVAQLAGRWTGSAHAKTWTAETRRSYRTALNLHILPELGEARVQQVTAFDIQRVMDACPTSHVANRCRRVMHALFGRAVAWGLIRANPVASVKAVRRQAREQAYWSREQATAFLDAASKSRYRLLFEGALVTGLRIGELVALQWRDVNDQAVHVRRTYSQAAVGRVQEHPKSATSRRRVPLPPEYAARLEAARGEPHELVFASSTGRLLNPGNVRRALRRYAKRAGVPAIRLHDLRRSYASFLAEAGYHPSVIQRLLGHASPDLALRVYTSVRDSHSASAVVDLGGSSGGSVGGLGRPSRANPARSGGGVDGVEHEK